MAAVESKAHNSERVCDLKRLRTSAVDAEEEARHWEGGVDYSHAF